MTTTPIRVLIVDDDALVRSALTLMLGGSPDLIVVGEVTDGADAVDAVRDTHPDVVLMDVRMPRMNGIDAVRALMGRPHPPKVVMLTTFDTDDHVLDALAAGADGFMVKDTPPVELVAAIRAVADGDTMLSPSVARTVVDHVRGTRVDPAPSPTARRLDALTERELEVAVAIGRGLSNAEIADELFMSVATVKAHVSRVLDKLGATNRVQVALGVHDAGLV